VGWTTPVTSGDLALKANLESPTFTGTPTLPTGTIATTQTAGNNTTAVATTAFVRTEVSNLVASAPAALDTLDELAAALGDDANFATTTATAIGLKAPIDSPVFTGTPTAPTAAIGTNTTQLATTAFVQATNPTGAVIAFAGSSAPSGWLLCFGQTVSKTTYATLFSVLSTTYNTGGEAETDFRLPDLRGRTIAGIDNMGGVDAGRLDIANSSGTVVGTQYVTLTSAQSGVPAHFHANTLSSNTVASSAHRHEFGFSLLDNFYAATGSNAAMGAAGSNLAGAYRYSTGQWQGAIANGTVSDTRRDATSASAGSSARMSTFGDTQTPSANTTVGISNVNNTAADASQAHNNMQPTMVLNYIIKA
jgi:microcystin-dependent protein